MLHQSDIYINHKVNNTLPVDKLPDFFGNEDSNIGKISGNMISPYITTAASFVDVLRYRSKHQGADKAYTFLPKGETEEITISYQELDKKARAIAAMLQSMEAKGQRALLLYQPGLEFIAAFFGCLYAGVVAVPVYPPRRNHHSHRLQAIVSDAQATIALTNTSVFSNFEKTLKSEPELANLNYITTDSIDSDKASDLQYPQIDKDTLAFLQYTSGSTGTPKGVMISHGNLLHNLSLIHKCFEHTPKSRGVIWLPPYHDMGLIGGVLQPIYGGCSVILMPPVAFLQKPIRWLQAISRYKATTNGAPNFAYDLCVENIKPEELASLDLSSWEVAFTGAEPVRPHTMERFARTFADCGFRKEAFYPCYGMAETTLIVSGGLKSESPIIRHVNETELLKNQVVCADESRLDSQAIVSCGRTCSDQKIAIVNPESSIKCGDGEVGEIWVRGESIARGYWRKPELTQKTFHAYIADTQEGPFLRTGDLGFLQHGELFVTGRIKDVIIIRGKNHYPQDIELTVENSHPSLKAHSCAAFSVLVEREERLVLACEIERTFLRNLNIKEVVQKIRKQVSEQHDLQVYAVVLLKTGSIPKTSSGKIQRYACRNGFLNGNLNVVGEWKINLQNKDLPALHTILEIELEQLENEVKKQLVLDKNKKTEDLPSKKSVPTEKEIEAWLVSRLARKLNILPDEIDVNESFADFGLDSSVAVSTTGDLAEWLGYELEPTLFWEYPNIKTLCLYLAEEFQSNSEVTVKKEV